MTNSITLHPIHSLYVCRQTSLVACQSLVSTLQLSTDDRRMYMNMTMLKSSQKTKKTKRQPRTYQCSLKPQRYTQIFRDRINNQNKSSRQRKSWNIKWRSL